MTPDPVDPYAPPLADPEPFPGAGVDDIDAYIERVAHLEEERVVASFAEAVNGAGTFFLVVGGVGAVLIPVFGPAPEDFRGLVEAAAWCFGLVTPGALCLALGIGLNRFHPWARRITIGLAIPAAVACPPWIWLSLKLVSTLNSPSGRLLFTEEHAELRAVTAWAEVPRHYGVIFFTFAGPLLLLAYWNWYELLT